MLVHMTIQLHHGWTFHFRRNVYMYCHELIASKCGVILNVPCEDSPDISNRVLIWLYELEIEEGERGSLTRGLFEWSRSRGIACKIYTSRNDCVCT